MSRELSTSLYGMANTIATMTMATRYAATSKARVVRR
jgi:hypothetical protein